ncbi:hypothetical protein, partial [Azospirillum sp. B506]|uniref:hypothetical protein n=1 Tax=Azospirillum sp. B506 TaxID=137721 RepID=UPI001B3B94A3
GKFLKLRGIQIQDYGWKTSFSITGLSECDIQKQEDEEINFYCQFTGTVQFEYALAMTRECLPDWIIDARIRKDDERPRALFYRDDTNTKLRIWKTKTGGVVLDISDPVR